MLDQRELRLQVPHQLVVGSNEVAGLFFRKCDVEAVVYRLFRLKTYIDCPRKEWDRWVQSGGILEDIVEEQGCLARLYASAAFCYGQSVGNFRWKKVGRQQLVNSIAKIIAKADGLVRVDLADSPFEANGSVDHVLHRLSRIWRIMSTPMFCTP